MPEYQPAAGGYPSAPPARANGATRYSPSRLRKLRPIEVRNALRRRWFEYQMPRVKFRDAPGLVDLGTPYGGWTIPGGLVEPSWICYAVGVGGDISFDPELIHLIFATMFWLTSHRATRYLSSPPKRHDHAHASAGTVAP